MPLQTVKFRVSSYNIGAHELTHVLAAASAHALLWPTRYDTAQVHLHIEDTTGEFACCNDQLKHSDEKELAGLAALGPVTLHGDWIDYAHGGYKKLITHHELSDEDVTRSRQWTGAYKSQELVLYSAYLMRSHIPFLKLVSLLGSKKGNSLQNFIPLNKLVPKTKALNALRSAERTLEKYAVNRVEEVDAEQ